MACALTVTDFFKMLVARRRRAETMAELQGPLVLRRWMQSDQEYQRRSAFYAALRDAAATVPWSSRPVESPAEAIAEIVIYPLHEVVAAAGENDLGIGGSNRRLVDSFSLGHGNAGSNYSGSSTRLGTGQLGGGNGESLGMIAHATAVASHGYRVLRPRHGLEELRRASGAAAHTSGGGDHRATAAAGVVLRFVDAVNAWRGEWVADLRKWTWTGWEVCWVRDI